VRRVLYLIDNYSLGGAQIVVKGILENKAYNDEVFSVALRKKDPVMEICNVNAIVYQSKSRFSFMPLLFLKRFIETHHIDILHCQLPRSIVFGYLLKILFFRKMVYIIHEQGDIFESWLYAAVLRVIARKSSGIIACSKATGQKLQERSCLAASKIRVIYNFVDLGRFAPVSHPEPGTFMVGFAGRIEKRKGWREFLQIAESLKYNSNLRFLMAGTGSEIEQMTGIIKSHNLYNVDYLGYLADMAVFYHRIHLLIIPSYFEPMGMVAIEAMASGVPVIASDVPGLNEIISGNKDGWLVPVHAIEPVIRLIEEFVRKPEVERQIMTSNAIRKAGTFSYTGFEATLDQYHKQFTFQNG
jgi:glycosyltransferase involved in cell wall biosynthesis